MYFLRHSNYVRVSICFLLFFDFFLPLLFLCLENLVGCFPHKAQQLFSSTFFFKFYGLYKVCNNLLCCSCYDMGL